MAWCQQAPSHYLNQSWPWSMSPYGFTSPQWVKLCWLLDLYHLFTHNFRAWLHGNGTLQCYSYFIDSSLESLDSGAKPQKTYESMNPLNIGSCWRVWQLFTDGVAYHSWFNCIIWYLLSIYLRSFVKRSFFLPGIQKPSVHHKRQHDMGLLCAFKNPNMISVTPLQLLLCRLSCYR